MSVSLFKEHYIFREIMDWYSVDHSWCILWRERKWSRETGCLAYIDYFCL